MNKKSMGGINMNGKWYIMPIAVLVLGIASIFLLIWTNAIIEKQHMNFAFLSSLEDLQIRAATSHFLLEESIAASDAAKSERAILELQRAVSLSNAIIDGGDSDHGLVLRPLKDPEFTKLAEAMRHQLLKFRSIALERKLNPQFSGISSDIDKHFDEVFADFRSSAETLDTLFQRNQMSYHLETSRLLFWIYLAWSLIVIVTTVGLSTRELKRRRAEEELLTVNQQLLSTTVELREHRENLAALVGRRTAELTSANERLRTEISERTRAEAALKESALELRYLSGQLMTAQETERRHISKELHDEFGHALSLVKLRLKSIERELPENNHNGVRDDCEEVIKYIDEVIENVRRLSRDLSPSILEDIGLTASLQWLVDNFRKSFSGNLSAAIEDIDHLFSGDSRIMIYRIIQEALTNIGKHSGAKNASIAVQEIGDRVSFVIEDDGIGITHPSSSSEPARRGLGLTIMHERVQLLGGVLQINGADGKGTRLTFSIPTSVPELNTVDREGAKDAK